jgi:hypothetical protein
MENNNCYTLIGFSILVVIVAVVFVNMCKKRGETFGLTASPYYMTTFQAFPNGYMSYGSNRNHYCLQQHGNYAGYRNCMLYLQ